MVRREKRYDTQFRIVITQTMKTRLERAAKREGIPYAEFARRALQDRIDWVTAEAKRQAAERKAAKAADEKGEGGADT
jgi:cytidylate kinase